MDIIPKTFLWYYKETQMEFPSNKVFISTASKYDSVEKIYNIVIDATILKIHILSLAGTPVNKSVCL